MKKIKPLLKVKASQEKIIKHRNPKDAAEELDALLYFVHTRYSEKSKVRVPTLASFLVRNAEVVFSDKVKTVVLRKNPNRQTLEIWTPRIGEQQQEERRLYLLSQLGDLILKYQRDAYLHLRDMLLSISDPEMQETLVQEYLNYKASL